MKKGLLLLLIITTLCGCSTGYEDKIEDLENQMSKLEEENDELYTKLEECEKENMRLEEENIDLEDKLDSCR